MLDHEARIALAGERAAHLTETYRQAQRPAREPRRNVIRRLASTVASARRHRATHGPAYHH